MTDIASLPDWQPHLDGPHVRIRPLLPSDLENTYAAASDPLIWAQHSEKDRYQRPVFERFFKGALQSRGGLALVDRSTGEIMGSSRFYDWNPADQSVVIGYTFLSIRYWGTGTNREVKALMLAHAFRWAKTVWFHVSPENRRSQHALEKLGATFDRQQEVPVSGKNVPRLVYRIDRAQFGV